MHEWEYAVLVWDGEATGKQRDIIFSHRDAPSRLHGTLAALLRKLDDEGWEMVDGQAPSPSTRSWEAFPKYAAFKRKLAVA